MEYILTCNSGLESLVKQEINTLGYKIDKVDDKLIFFKGDLDAIGKVNLWSRVGNKLFMVIKSGYVKEFEDLFQLVNKVDWNYYIANGQGFVVQGTSIKSTLSSVPAIQSVSQKSIYNKLLGDEGKKRLENGNYGKIEIHIIINNNKAFVLLNTTGYGLHKRGYRNESVQAPLKENIAAGLILLSNWDKKTPFYDFFAGSGTIPIEAALIAKNVAPGLFRSFDFENFQWYDQNLFQEQLIDAKNAIIDSDVKIYGFDMDPLVKDMQYKNAKAALVDDIITFETKDFIEIDDKNYNNIFFISNPPYGLRLSPENLKDIYDKIADFYEFGDNIKGGVFTGYNEFYKVINKKMYKQRKLYNGGELCHFYRFIGN